MMGAKMQVPWVGIRTKIAAVGLAVRPDQNAGSQWRGLESLESRALLSTTVTDVTANGTAIETLANNESLPVITIRDVSSTEGFSGNKIFNFRIDITGAFSLPVSLMASTADGSATTADFDYTAVNSQLVTFTAGGPTFKNVAVTVRGDSIYEGDQTFLLNLFNPVNATIADNQGIGTIVDDDGPPPLDSVTATGGIEAGTVGLRIELLWPSDFPVVVSVTTTDVNAIAGVDYVGLTDHQVTFDPRQEVTTVFVQTIDDNFHEPGNETFLATVTMVSGGLPSVEVDEAYIYSNESAPVLRTVGTKSFAEGDTGLTQILVGFHPTGISAGTMSFQYRTVNNVAISGVDYESATGTVVFAPYDTSEHTISLNIIADAFTEQDELFYIELFNPQNINLSYINPLFARHVPITIVNDDAPPTLLSLSSSPDPVVRSQPLVLTANGVADQDGPVNSVWFYRDSDFNGIFDPATDLFLGTDADGIDDWSQMVLTSSLPLGINRFFAFAKDGVGESSSTVNAVVQVVSDKAPIDMSLDHNVINENMPVVDSIPKCNARRG